MPDPDRDYDDDANGNPFDNNLKFTFQRNVLTQDSHNYNFSGHTLSYYNNNDRSGIYNYQ